MFPLLSDLPHLSFSLVSCPTQLSFVPWRPRRKLWDGLRGFVQLVDDEDSTLTALSCVYETPGRRGLEKQQSKILASQASTVSVKIKQNAHTEQLGHLSVCLSVAEFLFSCRVEAVLRRKVGTGRGFLRDSLSVLREPQQKEECTGGVAVFRLLRRALQFRS